jgi:hypothetical protein
MRETARQNYLQAQKRAQETRQQIIEKREQAEKAKQQLLEQEKKIPKATQKSLRFGQFAGLGGRKQRRQATKIRGEIGKRKERVSLFKQELKTYEEKELVPFEKEIKKFKDMWGF